MRCFKFSQRCLKEILRDPLNLAFGFGFPIVLLLLLNTLQKNIPTPLFTLEKLTPGICVFGLSFMTLFSATLIAKDRETAFHQRLYTTPLTSFDFIFGYMIAFLPIAFIQTLFCFIFAMILGLKFHLSMLYAIIGILPMAFFNIALGLLCGSIFNVKQVGGICGALLTNLSAWLSGVWFDLSLVGGIFEKIAHSLPFYHAVALEQALLNGSYENILIHLLYICCFCIITVVFAVIIFLHQSRKH